MPGDLDYGASKTIEQQNILKSVTTGLKMDIGDWKLDGYYQYGRTDSNINMNGAIRLDRIYQAIDAVKDPGRQHRVQLHRGRRRGNGCVPLNLFGVGSPSQDGNRLDHAGHLAETDRRGERGGRGRLRLALQ